MAVYDPEKVINIALDEVGYLEKKSNSNLDSKTANAGYNNYTKYGRDMHKLSPSVMDFPAAWCDAFVDWCFFKAYGEDPAKQLLGGAFNDYTVTSKQLYKNKGRYHVRNGYAPQAGDQIFFKNASGGICHTGLVYKVDSSFVYTVEGNTSSASGVVANGGCVAKKSYKRTYSRIDGYGNPNYGGGKKTYSGTFPVLPTKTANGRTWYQLGDGYKTLIAKKTQIKRLQAFLNWYGAYGLTEDGKYGANTEAAVKKFQGAAGLAADGQFGTDSLKKAKAVKK